MCKEIWLNSEMSEKKNQKFQQKKRMKQFNSTLLLEVKL